MRIDKPLVQMAVILAPSTSTLLRDQDPGAVASKVWPCHRVRARWRRCWNWRTLCLDEQLFRRLQQQCLQSTHLHLGSKTSAAQEPRQVQIPVPGSPFCEAGCGPWSLHLSSSFLYHSEWACHLFTSPQTLATRSTLQDLSLLTEALSWIGTPGQCILIAMLFARAVLNLNIKCRE